MEDGSSAIVPFYTYAENLVSGARADYAVNQTALTSSARSDVLPAQQVTNDLLHLMKSTIRFVLASSEVAKIFVLPKKSLR